MAFQVNWLWMSKKLIEDQFDQKVNLAIGSALTDYNASHHTTITIDELQECDDDERFKYLPIKKQDISFSDQLKLERSLGAYMTCYGIDEKYNVEIFDSSCKTSDQTYCCSIGTKKCDIEYTLGVSFESKEAYIYDKLMPMILSSILIFILLAVVSFFMLWSLVKQKRITENNIDFFNNTAHELKTPLTNISLALKLLEKKHEGLKEDQYAKIIRCENNKLASQIDRVLFLSKMENGEYDLKKEKLNLNDLLMEVVENMKLVAQEKNGQINFKPTSTPMFIEGDYYHLSNVFRNLIDNAIKYCDKDPVIDISILESGLNLKVLFSDNGIGISAQDQFHIFEKFQRVNTGNVHEAKGFGIGLSYVKTVIEMHKGLVQVESELHKGSQFQLLIPHL